MKAWHRGYANPPAPRSLTECKETHGYDAYFMTRGLPDWQLHYEKAFDPVRVAPQPEAVAHSRAGSTFFTTFGVPNTDLRLFGSVPANSVNVYRKPSVLPSGPMSVPQYVRTMLADVLRDAHGRLVGQGG